MPKAKPSTKGLIIVYTGEGKGKTTAAMGLAVRAVGYGLKVGIIQFAKVWFTGEKQTFEDLGVDFRQLGAGFVGILGENEDKETHRKAATEALGQAEEMMLSNKYQVVVLDEVIGCEVGGLLDKGSIVGLLAKKPAKLDMVLTGRHAETIAGLVEAADLVTEMKKIKHPYDAGILAKKGIDY
jgi:cob(I)alamin adenosyltransferase